MKKLAQTFSCHKLFSRKLNQFSFIKWQRVPYRYCWVLLILILMVYLTDLRDIWLLCMNIKSNVLSEPYSSAVESSDISNTYDYNLNPFAARCELPALDVFSKDALLHHSKPEINCGQEFLPETDFPEVAFTIKNGHHLYQLVNLSLIGLSCCFRPFFRNDDNTNTYSNSCIPVQEHVTVIPSHVDFTEVVCKDQHDNVKYRDAFALIHIKTINPSNPQAKRLGEQVKFQNENALPALNIAIIGLDATSRLNFIRQMPLSNDYLLHKMNAISLHGFSVIGSGSLKNLIPLLTGLSMAEFTMGCGLGDHVDACPFLWHEFSKRGYITGFAEDWSNFNQYWTNSAFEFSPATYYFRPYLVHMHQFIRDTFEFEKNTTHSCFGPRLSLEVILNFIENVRNVALRVNKPYFQFTWTARLSHEESHVLGAGDVPLLLHLQRFMESGALNNTVLLIIGDHGYMMGPYYLTTVGKQEYKLPLAYMVLPPWFSKTFPQAFKHLQGNSKRMTTAFDLHKTLKELMDLNQLNVTVSNANANNGTNGRGISLFKAIPENRNCIQAGISLKWCNLCHPTLQLNATSTLVQLVISHMLNEINQQVRNHSDLCHKQTFLRVKKAFKWDPRDVFMEICNVQAEVDVGNNYLDAKTKRFNISCDAENDWVDIVDLEFQTGPKEAIYHGQAIIIRQRQNKNLHLDRKINQNVRVHLTDSILRYDAYRESGYCVPYALMSYCICRNALPLDRNLPMSLWLWLFIVTVLVLAVLLRARIQMF